MKRIARVLVAIVAVAAVRTGVALAVTSPTVSTRLATGVTDTTAVLRAAVNPGGEQTGYLFQYGPTTSFGLTTASRSAGHGVKPVAVAIRVGGLDARDDLLLPRLGAQSCRRRDRGHPFVQDHRQPPGLGGDRSGRQRRQEPGHADRERGPEGIGHDLEVRIRSQHQLRARDHTAAFGRGEHFAAGFVARSPGSPPARCFTIRSSPATARAPRSGATRRSSPSPPSGALRR